MKNLIWILSILFFATASCAQQKVEQKSTATTTAPTEEKMAMQEPLTELPAVLDKGQYNELTEFEEYVIEKKGTERAFSGTFYKNKESGIYICRRCNQPLYASNSKFDSGTGWPSFDDPISEIAVKTETDADGRRNEILCSHCDGHLGHVFMNEGFTDKNARHCVNSASINFVKQDKP